MANWTLTILSGAPRKRFTRILGAAARALFGLLEILLVWQERARDRQRLAELDDHLLKDIGISRVDAWHEASKPFWRS
jgi:uncharacterized protein YjiS (DUF1127 family)